MNLLARATARLSIALSALLIAACASVSDGGVATGEARTASRDEIWFVFLESGKPGPADAAAAAEMQRGHIANFQRLFGEKKLMAAGPVRDPTEAKRGIVIVKAPTQQQLGSYFKEDRYVRDGYLKLNAAPALVNKALATEGIDSSGVEEVRIVQVMRGDRPLAAAEATAQRAMLQRLADQGAFSAWYTLEAGPVAEVLFSRNKDDKALQATLAPLPAVKAGAPVAVWGQWFAKGVVR